MKVASSSRDVLFRQRPRRRQANSPPRGEVVLFADLFEPFGVAAQRDQVVRHERIGQRTMSVAIELDQPLVADSEVMRDLVEHDVPDLAA